MIQPRFQQKFKIFTKVWSNPCWSELHCHHGALVGWFLLNTKQGTDPNNGRNHESNDISEDYRAAKKVFFISRSPSASKVYYNGNDDWVVIDFTCTQKSQNNRSMKPPWSPPSSSGSKTHSTTTTTMGYKCREQIKNCYNLTSSFIYFFPALHARRWRLCVVEGRQAEIPLHPKPFAGLSHNRSPLRLFGGIEVTWSFSSSSSPPIDLLTSHNCSRSMMIKLFPRRELWSTHSNGRYHCS